MNSICDGCGKVTPSLIGIGRANICRDCEPEIRRRIEAVREQGKTVFTLSIAREYYRETKNPKEYLVRDVPETLLAELHHLAIDSKKSVRELTILALTELVTKEKTLDKTMRK